MHNIQKEKVSEVLNEMINYIFPETQQRKLIVLQAEKQKIEEEIEEAEENIRKLNVECDETQNKLFQLQRRKHTLRGPIAQFKESEKEHFAATKVSEKPMQEFAWSFLERPLIVLLLPKCVRRFINFIYLKIPSCAKAYAEQEEKRLAEIESDRQQQKEERKSLETASRHCDDDIEAFTSKMDIDMKMQFFLSDYIQKLSNQLMACQQEIDRCQSGMGSCNEQCTESQEDLVQIFSSRIPGAAGIQWLRSEFAGMKYALPYRNGTSSSKRHHGCHEKQQHNRSVLQLFERSLQLCTVLPNIDATSSRSGRLI